jgi:hypothetical protein
VHSHPIQKSYQKNKLNCDVDMYIVSGNAQQNFVNVLQCSIFFTLIDEFL